MKRSKNYIFWSALLGVVSLCASGDDVVVYDVEVQEGGSSSQALFTFTKPFTYQKIGSKESQSLSLFFPESKLGSFNKDKLSSLKVLEGKGQNQINLVRDVRLYSTQHEGRQGVRLDITFTRDDGVLVKLVSLQKWKKLIVEIFSREKLQHIQDSSDGPLYLTQGSSVKKKELFA